MEQRARALAKSVHYVGAATVEFLYCVEEQTYNFLELNPRLQVLCALWDVHLLFLRTFMHGQAYTLLDLKPQLQVLMCTPQLYVCFSCRQK